jgi:chromosome segregation ATPase
MYLSKLKTITKIFFATLFLVACSENTSHQENDLVYNKEVITDFESIKTNSASNYDLNVPKNLKIIKSAKTRYKVTSVKDAIARIKKHAKEYEGYISDLQFQNNTYRIESQFTIKIPQENFDAMMDSINNSVEFVDYENITTKDVTEEYIDLETRLKTKTEIKERYEAILRKQAKTVKDILETEDKLRVIQEEIESSKGRLNYLKNRISFSTVQIELYETVDYKEHPTAYNKSFWAKTKEGLSNGWDVVSNLALIIINIWPIVLLILVVLLVIKKRKKIAK